jgi:hypothetical protein
MKCNEPNYVPSLYNNRIVDSRWRQLNWRLNSLGLEETLVEIQAKSSTEETGGEQDANRSNETRKNSG